MINVAYCRTSSIYDDSRATKEIKTLLDAGYTVTVLGWDRQSEANDKCREVFKDYENVSFLFFSETVGNNIVGKILSRINWSRWLKHQIIKLKELDIVHACDFDTAFPVFQLQKKSNFEMIYDIFDYYIDAHPVPPIGVAFVERMERKIINNSDSVIICTEERKEQIKNTSPKNLVVVHNSPDVKSVIAGDNKYDYVYCGVLNNGRLIREILDSYPLDSDLRCYFAGKGCYERKIEILEKETPNIKYGGSIPYSEVLEIEAKSLCLSAIYDPSLRNHRLCAPNKFYESLALGKPVIVVRGTGIDKIVEKEDIGMVINYSAEEFYSAVCYLKENLEIAHAMGKRARNVYERNYKWEFMEQKIRDMYMEIAGE